ncbi:MULTISPECIES: cysteine hydrolase family protein [Burkholderia]|uniref:Nicotinamidase-related amidase n=1 Tax=Burkholderia pyrrocinia TaxID=60550 RepID=A0A318HT82_BURPY|nr:MULTISPECIES: cysteine hydrolase [Burkholderia]PXX21685.1 nicotinamidase-related amidase [Burkholderia pyrrocinia]SFW90307.1 Nicotinamidase-related amidase [Burkholderia sp. NFACC33-1]SFY46444.1 Nicotinamidase-related amidase [Burkholderia sp. NFPP32]
MMTLRFSRRFKQTAIGFSLAAITTPFVCAAGADFEQTIRAISGHRPPDHLDRKTTAFVIIDFQKEFFSGRLAVPDGKEAMKNARRLLHLASLRHMPVFLVRHVAPADSAVFAINSEAAKLQPDIKPRRQDTLLQKSTVSAFASTDLDKRLKAAHITTIVVAGLTTHASVSGTARDAVPLGYHVIVASDASATRGIIRANGETIDKDTLQRAALAEIEDSFGNVMSTSQIMRLPVR